MTDKTTLHVSKADEPLAWLDMDDETLGKFTRKFIIMSNRYELERAEAADYPLMALMAQHGAVALIRMAHEANADTYTTELTAARSASGQMGDWKVTVKRLKRAASVDTHPKDGDVKQAPLVSGAVGEAETPNG